MLLTNQFPNGLRYKYVFSELVCLYMVLPFTSKEWYLYIPSFVCQNFFVSSLVELSRRMGQHFAKIRKLDDLYLLHLYVDWILMVSLYLGTIKSWLLLPSEIIRGSWTSGIKDVSFSDSLLRNSVKHFHIRRHSLKLYFTWK